MRACFESVEAMDGELAGLARSAGKLRYTLGAGLEALARGGGHHVLGFSSVEAYALERCERRARWIQESRGLARRLASLPALRRALCTGAIGWSMAQLLAKVTQPEDEAPWLETARALTVRQLQKVIEASRSAEGSDDLKATADNGTDLGGLTDVTDLRTLTVTVNQEDAWVFECARMIVGQVAGPTLEQTVEALLGEGTSSLFEAMDPRKPGAGADFELLEDLPEDTRQREWEAQRARWREEAEERCERNFLVLGSGGGTSRTPLPEQRKEDAICMSASTPTFYGDVPTFDGDATAIDAELRHVAEHLVVRELEMGRLAEAFWKADGWRRLGYATDAQYARERLGTSLSSVKTKRALARRVASLPALDQAIRHGAIGYEAACLVASVATTDTVEAWIERAHERTVKHLREEVAAAQILARLAPCPREPATVALWPPSDETLHEIAALESHIVSGAVFRAEELTVVGSQKSAGPTSGAEPCLTQLSSAVAGMVERLEGREGRSHPGASAVVGGSLSSRPSRRDRARGRVTLRLRVSAGTRRYYRWLERLFQRHGPRHAGFLRFLCASLVDTWKHSLGSEHAYAAVYARDRYRCTSPVCTRRDVTPHHLRFRSAGGDDSLENVTSLCVCCHLDGVHGGRLRATPPAGSVTWTLGRTGYEHTMVHGRRRVRSM